jgi:hypothetical protein
METQERRKLINDAFIERKLHGHTSLGQPLQDAFNRVNESITEKTNDLTERYNQLIETEARLKEYGLHNHYY